MFLLSPECANEADGLRCLYRYQLVIFRDCGGGVNSATSEPTAPSVLDLSVSAAYAESVNCLCQRVVVRKRRRGAERTLHAFPPPVVCVGVTDGL
jgi:hypothetical protein